MAQKFVLPDIGEGLVDAEIVKWHVAVGDTVGVDEVIVEVETAKAVVEIPSPFAGTVLELGGAEGDTVDVGAMLIVIGEVGEKTAAAEPEPTQREPAQPDSVRPETAEPASVPASGPPPTHADGVERQALHKPAAVTGVETGVSHAPLVAAGTGAINIARPRAMPVVRKAAQEAGVDLAHVPGTGPDGAVTRRDLDTYLAASAATVAPHHAAPVSAPDGGRKRMSRTRRTIAEHMVRSWQEIPHVTTFHEVDGTRILDAKSALENRLAISIPIEALVMKAVVPVLAEFPEFNATLIGEDVAIHQNYDLGVAVDTPDGLIVPVVHSVDTLGVAELAVAIADVAKRAKERTLTPQETTGHTFTVTNIGAIGGTHGTPIIPYGTTAILSIGRARPMPVAHQGAVVVATMLPLSLSYDHRVIDGALGQRFAARLSENLAEPALFLAG